MSSPDERVLHQSRSTCCVGLKYESQEPPERRSESWLNLPKKPVLAFSILYRREYRRRRHRGGA
jgi:hypothetical protein